MLSSGLKNTKYISQHCQEILCCSFKIDLVSFHRLNSASNVYKTQKNLAQLPLRCMYASLKANKF